MELQTDGGFVDNYVIALSFYKELILYASNNYSLDPTKMTFTAEKHKAVVAALRNHSYILSKAMVKSKDVRRFLEDNVKSDATYLLEDQDATLRALSHLKTLNDDFLTSLREERPF